VLHVIRATGALLSMSSIDRLRCSELGYLLLL